MTEPGNPFGDHEIAREVEQIRARLAALSDSPQENALELAAIRETLRRVASDNEELRLALSRDLGLRVDADR